jgi:hypothetical protein
MVTMRGKKKTSRLLSCGNCGGGLVIEHDEAGITLLCPRCEIRVAGPFTDVYDIPNFKRARST